MYNNSSSQRKTNTAFVDNIGDITDVILKKFAKTSPYTSIFTRWTDIVGQELASKSKPFKIMTQGDRKILVLKSKKGTSLELQHSTLKILDDVNTFLGGFVFSSIKIIQLDANEVF